MRVIAAHTFIFLKILFCSGNCSLFWKQQQKMGRAKMGQGALTAWVEDTIDKSLINKQRRKNEKNRYSFIYIHINSYDIYISYDIYLHWNAIPKW